MSSHKIPRKRYRGSNSPNESDEQDRTPAGGAQGQATYLETPPPSSPPRGTATSSHVPGAHPALAEAVYTFEQHTARDVYLGVVRKIYPDLNDVNLNDFELMALSSGIYEGPTAGIPQWLKNELDAIVELEGDDVGVILDMATEACNERVAAIGLKPSAGASNVSIQPVPDTDYSMRLWPVSERHWCLDFVHSMTHEPKNKPFELELWVEPLPDPTLNTAPWLPIDVLSRRLHSMEFGFGCAEEDIEEGEEKFALMDGQTCVLKRPGRRNVRFTVPNRQPVAVVDDAVVVFF